VKINTGSIKRETCKIGNLYNGKAEMGSLYEKPNMGSLK
jgi:hypothetical protein